MDSCLSESYNKGIIQNNSRDIKLVYAEWCQLWSVYRNNPTKLKEGCLAFMSLKLTDSQNVHRVTEMTKHFCADTLSRFFEREGKYDSSLYYLRLADTVYVYRAGGANSLYHYRVTVACRYARLYLKFDQIENARNVLLREAFNQDGIEQIRMLKELLCKYDKRMLKSKLDFAIANYVDDSLLYDSKRYYYRKAYLKYLGVEIGIPDYDYYHTRAEIKERRKSTISYLKKSAFYRMVSEL